MLQLNEQRQERKYAAAWLIARFGFSPAFAAVLAELANIGGRQ
jgi:hypothetical protein